MRIDIRRRTRRTLAAVTLIAGIAALAAAPAARADRAYSFSGTNQTGETFDRPDDFLTLSGRVLPYQDQSFVLSHDATCWIWSTQTPANLLGASDGFLYLYDGAFDPADPLLNLKAYSDDSGLLADTSLITSDLAANVVYHLVTTGYSSSDIIAFNNTISCFELGGSSAVNVVSGACAFPTDGSTICLNHDRFKVSVTWRDFAGHTGKGYAVPLGSNDSALFWFFGPTNFELLLKVLNGCGVNGNYWVFYAATTSVEFHVTVEDTLALTSRTYDNTLGVSAPAVTDTSAFACNPF
jgi:hypothetical protein